MSATKSSPSDCSLVPSVVTGPAGTARPAILASPGHDALLAFARMEGRTVEGEAGVHREVGPFAGRDHRPKLEIPLGELALDAGDPRRAIGAQGGDRLVPAGVNRRRARPANSGSACTMTSRPPRRLSVIGPPRPSGPGCVQKTGRIPPGDGSRRDPGRAGRAGRRRRGIIAGMGTGRRSWSSDVVLGDGETVHLRPIRPTGAPALAAFHAAQSHESNYRRYFSPNRR